MPYSLDNLFSVYDWVPSDPYNTPGVCKRHTLVTFNFSDRVEIYYSCLSENQDGQGKEVT